MRCAGKVASLRDGAEGEQGSHSATGEGGSVGVIQIEDEGTFRKRLDGDGARLDGDERQDAPRS